MLKRFLPFIFAGVLGSVAVIVMHRYLAQERSKLLKKEQELLGKYQAIAPMDVIVATRDIPEETRIAAEHLDRQSVPKQYVQPYASTRAVDILGMVTLAPVAKGEQILVNKLRPPQVRPLSESLAGVTPQGQRAVTIATDALTGVGGFLRPGDKVDVLWTFQVPKGQGSGEGELVTMTLYQGITILAVGPEMLGREGPPGEEQPASREGMNITLALTPEQTAVLVFAREQGSVQLSLRSVAEKDKPVDVPPANMATLVEALFGREALEEPPKPQRTVEVIRGLERKVESVIE